jgi:hypothetical protein
MNKKRTNRAGRARPRQMTKAMLLPMARAWADSLSMENHLHLEVLRSGTTEVRHLASLAQTAYITCFLCEAGYGVARANLFVDLDEIIAGARRAAHGGGIWLVDEAAWAVFAEMLTLHDQQLAVTPLFAHDAANERLEKFCADASSMAKPENPPGGDAVQVSPDRPANAARGPQEGR